MKNRHTVYAAAAAWTVFLFCFLFKYSFCRQSQPQTALRFFTWFLVLLGCCSLCFSSEFYLTGTQSNALRTLKNLVFQWDLHDTSDQYQMKNDEPVSFVQQYVNEVNLIFLWCCCLENKQGVSTVKSAQTWCLGHWIRPHSLFSQSKCIQQQLQLFKIS